MSQLSIMLRGMSQTRWAHTYEHDLVLAKAANELDSLTAELADCKKALGDLISIAENEYPEGDHPAIAMARSIAKATSDPK